MSEKELDLEVRRWLEFVLKEKTYNQGVLTSLKNLYYRGRTDVANEIKASLGIE